MTEFQAFTVGLDGHFIAHRDFTCDSDADAIVWAQQLVDGRDVEIRSGGRLVKRIHAPKSHGAISHGIKEGSDGAEKEIELSDRTT